MTGTKPTAASRLARKHLVLWFRNHAEEGDPDCLCSLCEIQIPNLDADGHPYVCIRLFNTSPTDNRYVLEARFHTECFNAALRAGLFKVNIGT